MNTDTVTAVGTAVDPLLAISAIDGRYQAKVAPLAPIVSEFGLMKYRVQVECAWFQALANCAQINELPELNPAQQQQVGRIGKEFSLANAKAIKAHEAVTNHDVKAVEYFVKEQLSAIDGLSSHTEFVHFACTSEDINNTAYALMLQAARDNVLLPAMHSLRSVLEALAMEHAKVPMLSRTHGQAASPTTLGKELRNVSARLQRQESALQQLPLLGKMNGAVGNFNAHLIAYPDVNWENLSADLLQQLGLTQNRFTTQIEPHDFIAEFAHILVRYNQVLLDFNRDVWSYIAIEYFRQRAVAGETGSSTMPHKVNPIDFENSEGNLGIASALLEHLASKLPVSRWQRDLSDSTVLRNLGSAFGHCLLALTSTQRGISRLDVNPAAMAKDLDNNWEVLGEAVQTVMRRYGMDQPYERLKNATRGKRLDAQGYAQLLNDLELPAAAMAALKDLTPSTYLGAAAALARND